MYRSVSWSRVSDDYSMHTVPKPVPGKRTLSMDGNKLPVHHNIEEMVKKEKSRIKFAENAVHFIPVVLLLCAFILWFFSDPNIEVGLKADSVAAKIDALTIEGDIDTDSDGTQTSILPVESGDIDKPKETNVGLRKKFMKRFK